MLILSIFTTLWYCVASSNLFCKLSVPAVAPSLTDIEQITRFLESQNYGPKILESAAVTENYNFKEATKYFTATKNEDIKLTALKLLNKYGYNVEQHNVTTEDGYILQTFRIPGDGPAVYLQHGLIGSSDEFVTAGPTQALSYYLADNGYDVWLGNNRGNKYARAHNTLDPECADFWDFSWHEMGVYDLPAMIDYFLKVSGKKSLSYVGWSQGTTTVSVLCAEKPEYNKKFDAVIHLAPVVFMGHLRSPAFRLVSFINSELYTLIGIFGMNEFLPNNIFTNVVKNIICADNPLAKIVCSNILFLLSGFDKDNLNVTSLPVEISHYIAGGSTKTIIHYTQIIQSNAFRQFDYGVDENLNRYGSEEPPEYDLSKMSAPVAMFYSVTDWLSNSTDTDRLKNLLSNVIKYKKCDSFIHFDYIFASDLRTKLYDDVLEIVKEYSSK